MVPGNYFNKHNFVPQKKQSVYVSFKENEIYIYSTNVYEKKSVRI